MKKLISTLLALSIVFSSGIAGNLSVSAATPTVTHNLPKTMKIGDSIGDLKDCNLDILQKGEAILVISNNKAPIVIRANEYERMLLNENDNSAQ